MSIAHQNTPTEYLTKAAYGKLIGRSERVIERYIKDGRLPDATKDDRGVVIIPAHVRPLDVAPTSPDVDALDWSRGVHFLPEVASGSIEQVPHLYTLEEYAEKLDTSVGGIRRLGDAGLLTVGPFGRNGALRVFIP